MVFNKNSFNSTQEAYKSYVGETYGAFEGVNLTGVGLDLMPELHRLLSGLFQCLVVFIYCLVQVRHLKGQRSGVKQHHG